MPSAAPIDPQTAYGFDPAELTTLNQLVRLRAERTPQRPFVTYLVDGGSEEQLLTYGDLETRALAVAGVLAGRGLKPGDRVLIMLPSGLEFIETFFGVLLAGMTPVPVYPPARLARLEHYLRTLASITETAKVRAVVVDDRLVPLVGKQLTFKGQLLVTDAELRAATEPGVSQPLEAKSPCFLQFTSGTTSQPRGVVLLQEHILAQLAAYTEALALDPDEPVVSWLPLYHDLGLIGKVLAALYAGCHLALLSPIDFLKEPMCWLRAITRYKAVHVAAPNFAYELCVRKCSPEQLRAAGIDLSSVDNAGMGGEPVSMTTVERFRGHFAAFGFRGDALNPCYGLAENTLVATGHRRGEPLRVAVVSAAGLQANQVRAPEGKGDEASVVGNGRPFPGMHVRIEGESGPLGERAMGEIWVRGPSLAAGYIGDKDATAQTFVERDGERWLRTGDLGFVQDGDLFICGRAKDLMIVRGRNFHPQDVEQVAGAVEGVRTGNAVAFSVEKGAGQGEVAILVAELDPKVRRDAAAIRADVSEAVSAAFQLALAEVILLPKGSVPKTSSGKLQRGLVKESYQRGDLATFVPPGRLSTTWLKVSLGAKALRRKLGLGGQPGGKAEAPSPAPATGGDDALDPRFAEALASVRPDIGFTLRSSLRVDGLGLDSLERVELWLQLERLYGAKVPEEAWSSLQTLGELQTLLEQHQGTAQGEAADDATSLLVRELLTPLDTQPEPFQRPFTAPLAFGFLQGLSRTFWRWQVEGHEHLDLEDGFILAGNHVTYLDGAWLHNALTPAVRERMIAYNFAGLPAFTQVFLKQMDTIPIDPEGSFRLAIRAGLQALEAGKALVIFPEGLRTHSGRMRQFRPGVALLSLLSGKPIVPFRTRGMFQIFPRDRALPRFVGWARGGEDRLSVRFGAPLYPPEHDRPQTWAQAQDVVRRLREAVEGL